MATQCPHCQKYYETPPSDGFCECGTELTLEPPFEVEDFLDQELSPAHSDPGAGDIKVLPTLSPAKLTLKIQGALSDQVFTLSGEKVTVGKFDPATGPVDIDLGPIPGAEYISRRHGELYYQQGQWLVRDSGSTNGIFVRRAGSSEFSPRLVEPAALQSGDEIAFGNVIFKFEV